MPKRFPVEGELRDLRPGADIAVAGHCELRSIAIHNSSLRLPTSPERRFTVREVVLQQCQHWGCSAHGTLFEDISITDFRAGIGAPSFLWGCLYSRVILKGWISGLVFDWQVDGADPALSRDFHAANLIGYRSVQCALDVCEARFASGTALLGIPSALVERNPESQFVMTLAAARTIKAEARGTTLWGQVAEQVVLSPLEDTVVVVGGSGRKLKANLVEARELFDRGLLQ